MIQMHAVRRRPRILVAGLGNELLGDDGVGVHAARELGRQCFPQRIVIADVGAAVLDALYLFSWADFIIAIDAMKTGGLPGTIYEATRTDIAETAHNLSLHELDFMSALRFLQHSHSCPEITILGVEPEKIDYSLSLSGTVAAALPRLSERVRQLIAGATVIRRHKSERVLA